GLPREPPSASTTRRRRAAPVPDPGVMCSPAVLADGRSYEDPPALLAAVHLVRWRRGDARQLHRGLLEAAAAAPHALQHGGTDAAVVDAQLLVQRHEVGRQALRGAGLLTGQVVDVL